MGTLTSSKPLRRGRTPDGVPGENRVVIRDLTLSSSYATGGDTLPTAASLGLKEILFVLVEGNVFTNSAGTLAVPVRYNRSTHKLQAFRYDGASAGKAFLEEVAAAVDLSAHSGRVRFEGIAAS